MNYEEIGKALVWAIDNIDLKIGFEDSSCGFDGEKVFCDEILDEIDIDGLLGLYYNRGDDL